MSTGNVSIAFAGNATITAAATTPITPGAFNLGINLSGLEDGTPTAQDVAGVDYAVPNAAELAYYHGQGLNLIRLPILWERLQPVLGGPLDTAYLAQIQGVVNNAAALGMKVVLDLHDYGGYGTSKLGDGTLTTGQFAQFWQSVATQFAGNPGIAGYDLMNEPNGLPNPTVWPTAAQAAISAIRSVDNNAAIYVEGDDFASAGYWTAHSAGLASLVDPANKLIFSTHLYLDTDNSGTHYNWDQQAAAGDTTSFGAQQLQNFVGWLQANHLNGDLGEIGASDTSPQWLASLNNTLAYAQASNLQVTYWAGGPWWNNYPLSAEPQNSTASAQMAVLDRYTGALATIAAPNFTGTADPNSTVAFFENGTAIGTATANAAGIWQTSLTGLSDGAHTIVVSNSGGTDTGLPVAALSFNLEHSSAALASFGPGVHTAYTVLMNNGAPFMQATGGTVQPATLGGDGTIQFSDGVGVPDPTGSAELIAHLYRAAFGHAPDLAGIRYWSGLLDSGSATLPGIASGFAASSEFQQNYAGLTDSAFVSALYTNVLGRPADSGGAAYWQSQLAGGVSRAGMLLSMSGSAENIQNGLSTSGDPNEAEAYRLYTAAFRARAGHQRLRLLDRAAASRRHARADCQSVCRHQRIHHAFRQQQ